MVRPTAVRASTLDLVRDAAVGAVAGVATRVQNAVGGAVNATLDVVVPYAVRSVLDRIDLTEVVIQRVDIDRVVAQADLQPVIDRLPLIDLAHYIIDEIDLPTIIRESTGGIAVDALNAVRMQSSDLDTAVSRIVDRLILRRGPRHIDAPGDPQSLAGEDVIP